ncbi:hypothetical protein AAII07_54405 [Microvirga sp. 0TCS3.31]
MAIAATVAVPAAVAVSSTVAIAIAATVPAAIPIAVTTLGKRRPVEDGKHGPMAEIQLHAEGQGSGRACNRNEDMLPPACHDNLSYPALGRLLIAPQPCFSAPTDPQVRHTKY